MKASELRDMDGEQLQEELLRLRKEQFGLRMQRGSEHLPQTHLLKETRRDIARVKTCLRALEQEQEQDQEQEQKREMPTEQAGEAASDAEVSVGEERDSE